MGLMQEWHFLWNGDQPFAARIRSLLRDSRPASGVERRRAVGKRVVDTSLRMSYCKTIIKKLVKDIGEDLKKKLPASFFPDEDPTKIHGVLQRKKVVRAKYSRHERKHG